MIHVSTALRRGLAQVKRRQLAPLEPDRFLAWAWRQGPRDKGTSPLTLDDVYFEWSRGDPEMTLAELRRRYVRIAARVRRNQRLNRDPWEGL